MPNAINMQDAIAAWLATVPVASTPEPTPDFRTVTTPADGLVDMAKPSQPKVDWQALALAAASNVKAKADIDAAAQARVMAQPTPWRNMGIRAAGTLAGGFAGIPLGPPGMAAGAGLGAALASNELAQPREVMQGTREGVNPLVGMMEGFAAMPSGPAMQSGRALLPQLPKVAAANFGLGTGGDSLVQLAETGTVDPMRAVQAGAMSAGIGVAAPVIGRGLTAVATSPAVRGAVGRVLADESGAVGPNIRESLPQQPDAAPGGAVPKPEVFTAPPQGANPAGMAEDIERKIATLKRLGQDDDAVNESVYYLTKVADDPMAQAQRGNVEPQAETFAAGERLRQIGAFEMPKGRASSMKFSVEDAAVLRQVYAAREEFLSRLREQMGPDLRGRYNAGDPEAIATVQGLSKKYGVNGIDGLERLRKETAASAL
jgi:hypothetical protein